MIKVAIAAPALRDLEQVLGDLSSDSPELAECFYNAVLRTVEVLTKFPLSGESGRLPETREIPVPETSYRIVYKYSGSTMVVLAILHTYRDPMNQGD